MVSTNARRAPEAQPVACAAASQRLLDLARRVAASDCTVLIVGESGTARKCSRVTSTACPSAAVARSWP